MMSSSLSSSVSAIAAVPFLRTFGCGDHCNCGDSAPPRASFRASLRRRISCYDASDMATLSYRTAGESHGKAMLALVEGMPAGVPIDKDFIDAELRRRQGGYGRGGRQKIETDKVEFLSGVRMNKTIASPVTMMIVNKDARLDDPKA